MAKLKYYTESQRAAAKQIAMLEYQEQKRKGLIAQLGGKCVTCNTCNIDTLILAAGSLLCANCRQKNRAEEARARLLKRKTELEASRLESWKQTTQTQPS